MIRSFTDRRPGLSAALIAVFFFLIPGALMFADDMLFGGRLNIAAVFFYLSIAAQVTMFIHVERPVLTAEPFIIGLIGLCAGEILYALSESAAAPGAGPGLWAYLTASYLIAVCGGNAAGAVGAGILYVLFLAGRGVWEHFKYR